MTVSSASVSLDSWWLNPHDWDLHIVLIELITSRWITHICVSHLSHFSPLNHHYWWTLEKLFFVFFFPLQSRKGDHPRQLSVFQCGRQASAVRSVSVPACASSTCRELSPPAGKMHNYELVHSSRVKFIYPSEEEMGDLTFIVAERKTPASAASSSSCSFNVLLYLLVFQVKILRARGVFKRATGVFMGVFLKIGLNFPKHL